MGVLDGLKPERVFYYFEEITKIPHGSYNVKRISDYCVSVANTLGFPVRQDEAYNVIIKKPGSKGCENMKTLMIQGHLDMVCVKDDGVEFDFEKDPLALKISDGFISAEGTSLGGDDGVAVAMGLAILEDEEIVHPPLEVVFTTEEEVGMDGAAALDTSDLEASYLLNLDSEDEGIFLAGCAGGACFKGEFDIESLEREGKLLAISIDGLIGGHSGAEIGKCRANAIVLLGRLLNHLDKYVQYDLAYLDGGEKDNAIAVRASAKIVIAPDDLSAVISALSGFEQMIKNEYRTSDPGIKVNVLTGDEGIFRVFTRSLKGRIMFVLLEMPNGIQTMSADLPDLPESSLNAGILGTDEDKIFITWALRSSVRSLKELLKDKLTLMIEMLGGTASISGDYPEWPYNPDSRICSLCCDVYKDQTGLDAQIMTIHAGVECGLLAEKMPGLDMVSMGPNMADIHTPREKLDIASVERTYKLVLEVLERFGKYCD